MKTCSYCGKAFLDDKYVFDFFKNSDTAHYECYRFCNKGHMDLFFDRTRHFLIPVNSHGYTKEEQEEVDRLKRIHKENELASKRKNENKRQIAEKKARDEYFGSERGYFDHLTKKLKK